VIVESSPICNAMRRDDPAVMPSRRGRIVNGPVVVKSEPEFAFELPDQMLTIGQHFRTTVASDHFRFDEDAVVARKKRKKGRQVGQIPDDPEGMPSRWGRYHDDWARRWVRYLTCRWMHCMMLGWAWQASR